MSEGMGASAQSSSSSSSTSPSQTGEASGSTSNSVVPANLEKSIQEPAQKPERHRVKIDGQEIEVDHSELIAGYQKSKASDKRFQEAAKQAKEAQQILKAIETGDFNFIESKLGKEKAYEIYEQRLIERMQYEQLSPAEKRALALEQENKSLKQRQEEAERSRKEAEHQEHLKKASEDLDAEVHQALKGLGAKPTPRLAVRVVDEMIARLETGKEAVPASEASKRALAGIHQDIAEYLPTLPVEQLVKLLPKTTMDALRQYEVNRVIGEKSQRRVSPRRDNAPKQQKPVGVDEWFSKIEQKYK